MKHPWNHTHKWKTRLSALSMAVALFGPLNGMPAQAALLQTASQDGMLLHYTFDQNTPGKATDASGHGNDGTLEGQASWTDAGKLGGAIDLNGTSAYVRLPDGLLEKQHDLTIATWVHADSLGTWARVFDFGSGTDNWMFLTLSDFMGVPRFSILPRGSSENLLTGSPFPGTGDWHHVAVVVSGNTYTLYLDGLQAGSVSNMQNNPAKLGATNQNFIGKSQFAPDPFFDGKIDDFRIYDHALSGSELLALVTSGMTDAQSVAYTSKWLSLGDTSQQTEGLNLPTSGPSGTTITWASSQPEVVAADGTVKRPAQGNANQTVTLTATVQKGTAQESKTFQVVVWAMGASAYTLNVQADQPSHAVPSTLYGIFFEDINEAADGGVYAELVKNRSFEFDPQLTAWTVVTESGGAGKVSGQSDQPLNEHNPQYVRLNVTAAGAGLANSGFGGIAVQKDARYNFSVYLRSSAPLSRPLQAQLQGADGKVYGSCEVQGVGAQWQKFNCDLTSSTTDPEARLVLLVSETATLDLDMVSLFPENTFKNRPNGLRDDLTRTLENLQPGFLRFPGGCIVEGGSFFNRYRWKNTIGDVAEREIQPNQWAPGYYQSFGLGFGEYFQLAADIGAEPLPILYAGQTSCTGSPDMVALEDLGPYIQDALDLIEYANGDVSTRWGAVRAAQGHPEPFNMKYLGVGNELWGQDYLNRYEKFYDVLKQKHPEIKLVLSAGAFPSDFNFQLAWDWVKKNHKADLIDEHMYQSPQWFYDNVTRYDNYDRTGPKVFVGEYAAHGTGKRNNMESALAEAAFMTGLERNSDVVEMASFAPLLAKENRTQWTTDLIWFNNQQVYLTPNYHVQQMFKHNLGQQLIPTTLVKEVQTQSAAQPITGSILLGSWSTAVSFDDVKITPADQNQLYNNDFADPTSIAQWNTYRGDWSIEDGVLKQSSATLTDARLLLGQGEDWNNYTLTLKACKDSGAEGFLIGFGSKNTNDYYWWNLGGWGNTATAVEKSVGGVKTTLGNATPITIEKGRWYDIKVEVQQNHIKLYLDGTLIHDLVDAPSSAGPLYSASTLDQHTGDVILKVVNTSGNAQTTQINLNGMANLQPEADVIELASASGQDENSFAAPDQVKPVTKRLSGVGEHFSYDFPAYSVTILLLHTSQNAQIASVQPVTLNVPVGKAPELPATVSVKKHDGRTEEVKVLWKNVDAVQYSTPGTFEVKGTLEGTDLHAVAQVTVTP
ncbi:alpha-L-arabinofuranosidase C-terminal domain-containing protein [Deinococcus roseus]|uniref:non-reducing end alpha-L-arabinofuranosidase n=1 Tax=Deinococcus roseus TaxID=392414 RepID=A0ABQ2CXN9_9DEIO|nr:alpha-L-arabinofuranosidase C-terminal domain-containing protein [Deinococcus roseus]GGJ31189.1 hypothetical protein GCM10008938_16670 [Deinococcus roseus]